MTGIFRRILRAAVLDKRGLEEVEADRRATGQAVGVVLLASIAGDRVAWSWPVESSGSRRRSRGCLGWLDGVGC